MTISGSYTALERGRQGYALPTNSIRDIAAVAQRLWCLTGSLAAWALRGILSFLIWCVQHATSKSLPSWLLAFQVGICSCSCFAEFSIQTFICCEEKWQRFRIAVTDTTWRISNIWCGHFQMKFELSPTSWIQTKLSSCLRNVLDLSQRSASENLGQTLTARSAYMHNVPTPLQPRSVMRARILRTVASKPSCVLLRWIFPPHTPLLVPDKLLPHFTPGNRRRVNSYEHLLTTICSKSLVVILKPLGISVPFKVDILFSPFFWEIHSINQVFRVHFILNIQQALHIYRDLWVGQTAWL